ncbi:MAG: hypothetical protein IPM06_20060 [Rhizobiales bacterium]|nr:hypothetical protein [Hyphomicrobiales bacterium]
MLAYLGLYSRGSTYVDKRAAGYDSDKATTAANLYSLAEAIPEVVPLGIILKEGGRGLTKIVGGTVTEAASEALTQGLQILIDDGVLNEKSTWGEATREMADAAAAGGVMGFVMGGTAVGYEAISKTLADRRAKKGTPADPLANPPARPVDPLAAAMAAGQPLPPGPAPDAIAAAMAPEAAPSAPQAEAAPPVRANPVQPQRPASVVAPAPLRRQKRRRPRLLRSVTQPRPHTQLRRSRQAIPSPQIRSPPSQTGSMWSRNRAASARIGI